jgi:RimJ/RimL family protein N-acetyltransferase
MMQRLGCQREGVRRQTVYMNGRYMDEILIGLTKEEFLGKEKELCDSGAQACRGRANV